MRLPKRIVFLGAVWEFNGSHLRDKIPQILRDLRKYHRMKTDTAVVLACYRVAADQEHEGVPGWEDWKTSRKK